MNAQSKSINMEPLNDEHPTYSIVAPVFNEAETLPHFYERVTQVMEGVGEPFEIVLINDGSRDKTYAIMKELHEKYARVRVIDFSRNFGHQTPTYRILPRLCLNL
jgi:glycosyltransferase involved in cell wall biosynthesis